MIKLVKYRFAHDVSSSSSPSSVDGHTGSKASGPALAARSGAASLDGLPIVVELRKLHREAGSRGKKAPRSSDEGKKWLDWSEVRMLRLGCSVEPPSKTLIICALGSFLMRKSTSRSSSC